MKNPALFLACMLIGSCSMLNPKTENTPIDIHAVPTEAGLVSGVAGGDGTVMIFKGIPFAAPPVGDLRWKPPVPAATWEGVRKCDTFQASAMQSKPAPFAMWSKEFMAPEEPLSEDCLYLNLWTAAKTTGEKRPVMVWIHGGAFTSGSGSVPLYDGEEMAKKGVVFVTINYRLGIFGFLAHPWLSEESPHKVSGNYGILDQIAALTWVKNNVAAFGGDTGRITIAGQSAGAFSVNALVISPLAKGLFHRAIAQSGGMFSSDMLGGRNLEQAEKAGLEVSAKLGAENIAQLRSLSAEELMKAGQGAGLVKDNYVLPSTWDAFIRAAYNDVPLITGWNADEFSFGALKKANEYLKEAETRYGTFAPAFLQAFPGSNDQEAAASQKLLGVLNFGWNNYTWAKLQQQHGKNNAYLYYFAHVPPGEPNFGAFHSAEFGYALKTLRLWDRPFTAYDHQLSETMSSCWVNFAANGNPNGEGLPEWPAFEPATARVMQFGDKVGTVDLPSRQQLEFLDEYNTAVREKK